MNRSSVGPFHRLQSFRNALVLCGSPCDSQVLLENLQLCGLLSTGHSSCPLQCGLTTGCSYLQGTSTYLPLHGALHTLQYGYHLLYILIIYKIIVQAPRIFPWYSNILEYSVLILNHVKLKNISGHPLFQPVAQGEAHGLKTLLNDFKEKNSL